MKTQFNFDEYFNYIIDKENVLDYMDELLIREYKQDFRGFLLPGIASNPDFIQIEHLHKKEYWEQKISNRFHDFYEFIVDTYRTFPLSSHVDKRDGFDNVRSMIVHDRLNLLDIFLKSMNISLANIKSVNDRTLWMELALANDDSHITIGIAEYFVSSGYLPDHSKDIDGDTMLDYSVSYSVNDDKEFVNFLLDNTNDNFWVEAEFSQESMGKMSEMNKKYIFSQKKEAAITKKEIEKNLKEIKEAKTSSYNKKKI